MRPCPSPEGTEPVHLRVAPNEVIGWRVAAGRSSGFGTRVSSMGRCLEPDSRVRDIVCTVGTRPASKARAEHYSEHLPPPRARVAELVDARTRPPSDEWDS